VILFGITTIVAILWGAGWLAGHIYGALLIVLFACYLTGIGWSIYRGVLDAPEDSDADSETSSESDEDSVGDGVVSGEVPPGNTPANEESALLGRRKNKPSTLFYLAKLLVALAALSISGYVLSHSSGALAARFNISQTVFGATILSLGTTLPEKFVAVVSGLRGHPGIMVANTVGSNIFLLTLCLGIIILSSQSLAAGSTYTQEIVWTWTSSALLMAMILIGTHRLVGLVLLLGYVAFVVLEFVLYKP